MAHRPNEVEKATARLSLEVCVVTKPRLRPLRTPSNMKLRVGLIAFVGFFAASGPANAYLDPGSVSLVIQGIVAALAGAALTWKHWYWRLRTFLRRDRKPGSRADDSDRRPRDPEESDDSPHCK